VLSDDLKGYSFEFLFVNDGSVDETEIILNALAQQDPRVKVLHFARNQGHQIALSAGMDFATGDMIVTIDADLQDPPEIVKQMIDKIQQGYEIVHAKRRHRQGESWFKLATARVFYKLMGRISDFEMTEDVGDFRAFTRPVLETVLRFRERHKFLRGIFAMIGYKQCFVDYDRDRRFAGATKYPLAKMIRLAVNAILSFSSSPLRFIIWLSFVLWGFSLIYLGKALYEYFVLKITVPGWTSIIVLQIFFTGIILFCMGIIGSYIGRIFEQGQRRPLYWIRETRNIDFDKTDDALKVIESEPRIGKN